MRALVSALFFLLFVSGAGLQTVDSHAAQQPSREKEAQAHYRVALVALKNSDMATAEDESKQAAQLVPKNALVLYKLAVVQSKRDEPSDAMSNLQSAMRLGLPADVKSPADDLLAELTYSLKKKTEQQAKQDKLAWLSGVWEYSRHIESSEWGSGCAIENIQTDSTIDFHPDQENGAPLVGTMMWSYFFDRRVVDRSNSVCNSLAKRQDMTLEYNVGVIASEDTFGGFKIVGKLISCSGNHCKDLIDSTTRAGYIEKNENGFEMPGYFIPDLGVAGKLEFHRSN